MERCKTKQAKNWKKSKKLHVSIASDLHDNEIKMTVLKKGHQFIVKRENNNVKTHREYYTESN